MTTAIILGSVVLLLAIAVIVNYFRRKDADLGAQARLERDQLKVEEKNFEHREKFILEYLTGHPDISEPCTVYLLHENNSLVFMEYKMFQRYPYPILGTIPVSSIQSITTEDQTTIEEKISTGRVLWLGMVALGWKKKKVTTTGYLIIEWKQGNEAHHTILCKEGDDAVEEVEMIRQKVMQKLNPYI